MSYGGMDEVQKLIMRVEGEEKLAALTKELELQRKSLADLIAVQKQAAPAGTLYTQAITQQAAALKATQAQIDATKKSIGNFGPAIQQVGYAVDDLVAGLNNQGLAGALANVQNNVPGLVMSLGAGAGLAGTIGLVGVGLAALVKNWDNIASIWGAGGTTAEAERMKTLATEASKAAEAIQKQIKALDEKNKVDTEAADIAKAALQEQGGAEATAAGVQKQLMGESAAIKLHSDTAADFEAKAAKLRAVPRLGEGDKLRLAHFEQQATEQRNAAAAAVDNTRQQAQEMVIKASEGDQGAIADLAKRFPGSSFGQATPEARRAQQAEVDAAEASGEALKRGGVKRRAAAGLVDALNDQGRGGEQLMGAQGEAAADDAFNKLLAGNKANIAQSVAFRPREAKAEMFKLEQQAAALTGQMMMDQMNGFGVEGIQQQINAMEQRYNALRMQLRKQMGGQMGGAQDTALPMHMPGGGGMGG